MKELANFFFLHRTSFFSSQSCGELSLVELMISTDEDDHCAGLFFGGTGPLAGLFVLRVDHQRECFDLVLRGNAEIARDFFNRLLAGCMDFERPAIAFGSKVLYRIEFGTGLLKVCSVLAIGAAYDLVFTGWRV